MKRHLAAILVFGLTISGCYKRVGQSTLRGSLPRESARPVANDFEDVLAIAMSKSPSAKSQLELIAASTGGGEHIQLARYVLAHWDDAARTFHAATPAALGNECLSVRDLRALYPHGREATRIFAQVNVRADGTAQSVSLVKPIEDERLRATLLESLRRRRYAPAKPGDDYVSGDLSFTCVLDVR